MVKDKLDVSLQDGDTVTSESPVRTVRTTRERASDALVEHYYTNDSIKIRLDGLQRQWGIENRSELTRWLLAYALDAVDGGKLKPRTRTVKRVDLE